MNNLINRIPTFEKKLFLQFKYNIPLNYAIEIEHAQRSVKTKIDEAPNKKRTIVTKFLNFKCKQQVLSKYKARKLWIKSVFINEDFSEDTIEKRKSLPHSAKELREEGEFAKIVYLMLSVREILMFEMFHFYKVNFYSGQKTPNISYLFCLSIRKANLKIFPLIHLINRIPYSRTLTI